MIARRDPAARTGKRRSGRWWTVLAALEVLVAGTVIVLDFLVPTIVVLALLTVSLLARREGPATLGFHRLNAPWRSGFQVLGLTVAWTVVQLALILPVLEHLTGDRQDLGQFAGLRGDVGMLAGLLVLSWTLAAVGEELVYRGYLQTRITDVLGTGTVGVLVAVLMSSVLFAVAHTEQGLIGVVAVFLDALFFSLLRLRYRSLWASVLGHGFNNTIGLTAYFLLGPVYGLW